MCCLLEGKLAVSGVTRDSNAASSNTVCECTYIVVQEFICM